MADRNAGITRRAFLSTAGTATAAVAVGAAATRLNTGRAWAEARPIRIGHQCDLTGPLASTGYWRKKTTDAAATWLNSQGGIAGRPIEIVTVDTESKVDVGVLRLRQLIQDDKVDFVIGSEHGGISIASNPVAKDLKTIMLSLSRTDNVTGTAGNPYIFRLQVDTSLVAKSAGGWMVSHTGKRWTILYADYVWGQGHRDAWSEQVKKAGGTVLQAIPMPVNTADPLSYVLKLDRSADCIFVALLAPDVPRALTAINQIGLSNKNLVTADALFGTFDVLSLGAQVEGLWGMDSLPWELADKDTSHLRNMRNAVGIDEHGREVGTKRFAMMGDIWPAWENLSFLKRNIEGAKWQSRSDHEALIKYAEAHPNYSEGDLFPQGNLLVRAADHQAFCDYFALRIEKGRIRVKDRMPKEAGIYPPVIDLASK